MDENPQIDVASCHIMLNWTGDQSFDDAVEGFYTLRGDLSELAKMLTRKADYSTEMRIGLIDGDWRDKTGFDNRSRFVFLAIDGFKAAWDRMKVQMDPAYNILAHVVANSPS